MGYWGDLDNLRLFGDGDLYIPPSMDWIDLENGDFESGTENWNLAGLTGALINNYTSSENASTVLDLWVSNDEAD